MTWRFPYGIGAFVVIYGSVVMQSGWGLLFGSTTILAAMIKDVVTASPPPTPSLPTKDQKGYVLPHADS